MKDLKINIFRIHGPIYFNHFIYMYFSILRHLYKHFSLPDTHTYVYVSGGKGAGGGDVSFLEHFMCCRILESIQINGYRGKE